MDSLRSQPTGSVARPQQHAGPSSDLSQQLDDSLVRLQSLSPTQLAEARNYGNQLQDNISTVKGLGPQDCQGSEKPESLFMTVNGPQGPVTVMVVKQRQPLEGIFGPIKEVRYKVYADGHSFDVKCVEKLADKARHYIQVMLEQLLKIPPHLRKAIKEIEFTDQRNPYDDYWAKEYNIPDFESAATAGNGKITVWALTDSNADDRIRDSATHEGGHLVGEAVRKADDGPFSSLFGSGERYPKDWDAAVRADNRPVDTGLKVGEDGRNYSESSLTEDFAEAFALFTQAKVGEFTPFGSMAIVTFRSQYPNRARILEDIWSGKRQSRV